MSVGGVEEKGIKGFGMKVTFMRNAQRVPPLPTESYSTVEQTLLFLILYSPIQSNMPEKAIETEGVCGKAVDLTFKPIQWVDWIYWDLITSRNQLNHITMRDR